ncbi:MAG: hypothetical protein WC901_04350 [Candidatus Margulisiibacteriota bacterium]
MEAELYRRINPALPGKTRPLPFLVPSEIAPEVESRKTKSASKMDLFEKGLTNELKCEDTINATLQKIVQMALAAEFGAAFVKSAGAKTMIKTLVRGIQQDRDLRKSALMIADRYATK